MFWRCLALLQFMSYLCVDRSASFTCHCSQYLAFLDTKTTRNIFKIDSKNMHMLTCI